MGEAGSRADDVEQGDFWTGYYQKIEVTNKKPEKLGEIKINTDKLRPNGGLLTFELCEGVSYLCLGIFEEYDMEVIKDVNAERRPVEYAVGADLLQRTLHPQCPDL